MVTRRAVILLGSIVLALGVHATERPLELGDEAIWLDEPLAAAPSAAEPADESAGDGVPEVPIAGTTPTSSAASTPAVESDPEAVAPLLRRGPAESADSGSEGAQVPRRTVAGGWWRTLGSLAGVVALIVLLAWGYRLAGGHVGGAGLLGRSWRPHLLEVVARTSLGPRQSACLVRVGGRLVLVGLSKDTMQPLDVISDAAEAARLLGDLQAQRTSTRREAPFDAALAEESQMYATVDEEASPPALAGAPRSARRSIAETLDRLRSRMSRV